MKRFFFAAVILSIALRGPAFAGVNEPATAKEWYEQYGQVQLIDGGIAAASTPGTLWNNGPNNLFDSLSSEADTLVTGTGGPEGDHGSTVADDFLLTVQSELTEIRVCFFSDTPTAELYIYADDGGMPGPSVTAPIFGGPTTASVVTTTYNDNTARCQPAFGYPGREYVFNASTTGVTLPTLAAGRYWLAVVGRGPGSPNNRAFWATSSPSNPLIGGVWGSTFFGEPYWSSANSDFAFDVDGRRSATSVPALTDWGILILILLAGLGAIHRLQRQGKAEG
jgi:hypothetical protein